MAHRDNPGIMTAHDAPDPFLSLPVGHTQTPAVDLQSDYITALHNQTRKAAVDFSTFAQLSILFHVLALLLLAILRLGCAPVALPLQHVADHHPQQAQEEEHRHQNKGDVVRLGFESPASPRRRRLTGWWSEREKRLQIILNVKLIVIAMSLRAT